MKRSVILAGGAAACLSLSACSTLSNLGAGGVGAKILDNLEACRRHYQGGIGAGVTMSFDINCEPAAAKVIASDLSGIRTAEPPPSPPGGT